MMFFGDGQYPRCALIIRSHLIGLDPSSSVYAALVECCENESLVAKAVDVGTYPRVKIAKLMRKGFWARNVPGAYIGDCSAADINYVYVNMDLARAVERTFSKFAVELFERTVLHEVVHWARYVGKKPAEIDGKEAGSWFEYKAYGIEYIGHSGLSCSDA